MAATAHCVGLTHSAAAAAAVAGAGAGVPVLSTRRYRIDTFVYRLNTYGPESRFRFTFQKFSTALLI